LNLDLDVVEQISMLLGRGFVEVYEFTPPIKNTLTEEASTFPSIFLRSKLAHPN